MYMCTCVVHAHDVHVHAHVPPGPNSAKSGGFGGAHVLLGHTVLHEAQRCRCLDAGGHAAREEHERERAHRRKLQHLHHLVVAALCRRGAGVTRRTHRRARREGKKRGARRAPSCRVTGTRSDDPWPHGRRARIARPPCWGNHLPALPPPPLARAA
eukprot:7155977-Prymnesium_polylepis.1